MAVASSVTFSNPNSVLFLPQRPFSRVIFSLSDSSAPMKQLQSQFFGLKLSHSPSLPIPLSHSSPPRTQTLATLRKGKVAPNFRLKNQNGKQVDLMSFRGNTCVVYFYPGNKKSGCTKQACAFRDNMSKFEKAGANVIGISEDSSKSHLKFASKNKIPYTLASDRRNKVKKKWGVKGAFSSKRQTFVLDKNGVVKHVYKSKFRPKKHVSEALKCVEKEDKKNRRGSMPFVPRKNMTKATPFLPGAINKPRRRMDVKGPSHPKKPAKMANPFTPKSDAKKSPSRTDDGAPKPMEPKRMNPLKPLDSLEPKDKKINPLRPKPRGSVKENTLMPKNPFKPKSKAAALSSSSSSSSASSSASASNSDCDCVCDEEVKK